MIKETLSFLHKTFVNLKVKQLLKGVWGLYYLSDYSPDLQKIKETCGDLEISKQLVFKYFSLTFLGACTFWQSDCFDCLINSP